MSKNESKGLRKLLEDQLADLYYAEKQVMKALPKMAKAASNDELRAAFEEHLEETEGQVERLEQMFKAIGKTAKGKKCEAIEGILDEGKEIMEEYKGEPALDAGLVAAAQKVEHYEITSYGSLKAWAEQLGLDDVVQLVEETLEEEKGADETLTGLAEEVLNAAAEEEEEDEDMDGSTKRTGSAGKSVKKAATRK